MRVDGRKKGLGWRELLVEWSCCGCGNVAWERSAACVGHVHGIGPSGIRRRLAAAGQWGSDGVGGRDDRRDTAQWFSSERAWDVGWRGSGEVLE